jgi:hypothetical protein
MLYIEAVLMTWTLPIPQLENLTAWQSGSGVIDGGELSHRKAGWKSLHRRGSDKHP